MSSNQQVLTFEEVAESYRLGRDALRGHIARGLPHFRAGGKSGKGSRYLFFAEQVRDYFTGLALREAEAAANRVAAASAPRAKKARAVRTPKGGTGPIRTSRGYEL